MTIKRVWIQKERGEFLNRNGFTAQQGFERKGYEVRYFEWPELKSGTVPLEPSDTVVGGVGAVRRAQEFLGVRLPDPLDLPERLAAYRGRRIWESTLGEVRRRVDRGEPPAFVKPLREPKAFAGHLVAAFRDLIVTAEWPADFGVLLSEPVSFRGEWRYYVQEHAVVGVGHYSGDPLANVDPKVVRRAVEDYRPEAPSGYALDFGVAEDGRTLLVEANDGYSLGNYGLQPTVYANLLEARWVEVVAGVSCQAAAWHFAFPARAPTAASPNRRSEVRRTGNLRLRRRRHDAATAAPGLSGNGPEPSPEKVVVPLTLD